jgi:hypothetical protein
LSILSVYISRFYFAFLKFAGRILGDVSLLVILGDARLLLTLGDVSILVTLGDVSLLVTLGDVSLLVTLGDVRLLVTLGDVSLLVTLGDVSLLVVSDFRLHFCTCCYVSEGSGRLECDVVFRSNLFPLSSRVNRSENPPEDDGNTLLRNTASHSRRLEFTYEMFLVLH